MGEGVQGGRKWLSAGAVGPGGRGVARGMVGF